MSRFNLRRLVGAKGAKLERPLPWKALAAARFETLERRTLLTVATIPTAVQDLGSSIGADCADPVRNVAYVVDQGTHHIVAISTSTGTTVGVASPVANVAGLAVSVDDTRLFASEPGAFQIEVFSLPSMTLLKTLPTTVAVNAIVPIANDRIIGDTGSLTGIDANTGAVLYTLPEPYNGLFKSSLNGTRLYSRARGLSGNDGSITVWDTSGTGTPTQLSGIPGPTGMNSTDFAVDTTAGHAYFEDAAAGGLEVTQISTGAQTLWTYPNWGALNGVATLPGGPLIYITNSYGTVGAFNEFGVAVSAASLSHADAGETLVITPNGNCICTYGTGVIILGLSSLDITENAPVVPSITTNPQPQTANTGQTATFTAAASGYPTPTAQWQISTNGTIFNDIPGATSATYTFTTAIAQNGDLFRAVFTNSQGSATTNAAGLTVSPAPAAPMVATQPVNHTIAAGQNVSFTAAASGTPTPTLQWQISTDGTTYNNIPGATSSTYMFAAAAGQNGDLFRAVFTNSQGSATTNAATLTVNFAPVITTQPLTQSTPASQNLSFIAAASGNPTPTVQWQVSTDGTTFNNISGATSTTYTFAATLAQSGDQFRAVFTNSQSSATTNAATLTVTPTPVAPAIMTEPGNQNVTAGTTASFIAAASGSPAPTVRWQVSSDGTTFTDVPGATSPTYAFTAALGQNGELFRAVFSNSQGAVPTSAATLTVTPAPAAPTITTQPGDQSGSAGDNVSFTATADGYPSPTVQWQVSTDGTTFNDIAGATSPIYTVTATAGQTGNLFRAVFTNALGSATTNAAVLNPGIAVGTTPSPAILTLGHVTLPTVAVVGVPFNGKVPVTITNNGATTLSGNFMLNIYANANPTLDGGQMFIASLKSHFALKSTKSRTLIVKVRSLPTGLTPGPYYAVTEVVDPQGGSKTTATGQPFQLDAAVVTLNVAQGNVLPATIPVGKFGSISVTVTNNGNVVASGPLVLTLSPSSDGVAPVAGVTLAQINARRVRIAPGKSAKFKLRFKVTAATTTGPYFPYLSVSLAGVTQTTVGSVQFTIE